ncbi:M28 family peptidase [Acidobacteriota bacterium]
MKKNEIRLSIIGVALFLSASILSGDIQVQNAVDSITEAEIRDHIYFLASDALRGRDTGDTGYEIAAEYAASQFMAAGVRPLILDKDSNPGYPQLLNMTKFSFSPENTLSLRDGGDSSSLEFGTDYFIVSNSTRELQEVSGPLVFIGYGIEDPDKDWDDLERMNVSGSIPIVMFGLPGEEITSAFAGQSPGNPWTSFQTRISALESRGAVGIVAVLDPRSMDNWARMASSFTRDQLTVSGRAPRSRFPDAKIPVIFLGPQILRELFSNQDFDPVTLEGTYSTFSLEEASLTLVTQIQQEAMRVPNLVGVVEGSDPTLKNEFVVLGAHLDHLGIRSGEVYNGADDNASGSVGVLEVAEAIALAPPKRSLLFVLFTGEERGLLGSRYFVENSPVPLKQIVAVVNIEMIGRWSHRPLGSDQLFAIIGNSEDGILRETLTKVNEAGFGYQLDVPEKFFGGSDHAPFHNAGIPNITIAGSPPYDTHDDYHRPGDDADKIDISAMRKAAALIYKLTLELANRIL